MRDIPAVDGYVANVRDITDRKHAEAERIEAEERFRQGFERSAFGLAVSTSSRRSRRSTPRSPSCSATRSTACSADGRSEFLHPAESETARTGIDGLLRGDAPHYKREHRMVRADGSVVSVFVDMTIVRDALDEPSYYFVQVRDITDRKRAEDALAHQALHDDLTRLPNRLLLVDRLSHSLAPAERTDSSVAVLFLDLDRFKLVNDGLGHVVGDQLLIEVARRLSTSIRASDTVARFGGDEFVIVREDIQNVNEAVEFAERIAAAIHEPISLSGREVYATDEHRDRHRRHARRRPSSCCATPTPRCTGPRTSAAPASSCSATSCSSASPPGSTSRPRCAEPSTATSSSCSTSRSCASPTAGWWAPRRSCGGTARVTASSCPPTSSPSPRRPG